MTDGRLTWKCPACGLCTTVDPSLGPVHCICGTVDPQPTHHAVAIRVPKRRLITTYSQALRRWRAAGYPVATDTEVTTRFLHCKRCEFFNGEICTHLNCGCNISVDDSGGKLVKLAGLLGIEALTERAKAMTNKLRMATESCPIGKWGPIETD